MVLLSSCFETGNNGQKIPSTLPQLPYMWVSKQESDDRRNMFATGKLSGHAHSKLEVLNIILQTTPHPKSYTLSLVDFHQLMQDIESGAGGSAKVKALRVYFAAYDPKQQPDQPTYVSGFVDKQIVLIFSPTNGSYKDLGEYYYIGSDQKSHRFIKNNVDVIPSWIKYYQDQEAETALVSTLDPLANRGEYGPDNITTETKSMLYCYEDFKDYIDTERLYLDNNRVTPGAPIDAIEIDFASFTSNGYGTGMWFKNRLHILFEFKRNGSNVSETTDDPNYNQRLSLPKKTSACIYAKAPFDGGDNSQLCPPYNCPPH